ncbi:MAG: PQQ-binding-like beta-propeller repeat protein, partial [Pirellulaceae bacterium]
MLKRTGLIAILLLCSGLQNICADDWPQWMGALMNGVWNEPNTIDSFPESGPDVLWRAPIGAGYTGPSVVGDHLYVMDRTSDEGIGKDVENDIRKRGEIPGGERIVCMNTETGEIIWQHSYDCPYKIAYPTGPRCTPTVDGEYVYTLGAMGNLKCLSTNDGTVKWEISLTDVYGTRPPPWGFSSHPIIDGSHVIVPVGGEGSAVVCFDKLTGEEIWKNLTSSDVAYAPLLIYEHDGERQLLMWHGDGVDSLNPLTGEHFWHHKFPEEKAQAAATSIVTPRIVGNQY